MYGDVVLGCKPENKDDHDPFEELLDQMKKRRGVAFDTELTADDLKELVAEFKQAVHDSVGKSFPEDPREQLWGAVGAVFGSWMNDRAIAYRKLYGIPDSGARRSTCRPWSSATPATTPAPAWPSPATRPPARTSSTASSWSTPRARTWSPACARRAR